MLGWLAKSCYFRTLYISWQNTLAKHALDLVFSNIHYLKYLQNIRTLKFFSKLIY